MCHTMRPQTRDWLLYEERAYCTPREKKDPSTRKARRKYRKLVRLAEKQGVDLDVLLLRRKADRQWARLQAAVGGQTVWRQDYHYTYVVEILRVFKQPHTHETYSYSQKRRITVRETHRAAHIRVLGIDRISDTQAPTLTWDAPLPVGHEAIINAREVDVWRLDHSPPTVKSMDLLVKEKLAYCQDIIDKDQRTLAAAEGCEARGGYASEVLTWARSGIESWGKTKAGWEKFWTTYRKMGRLDLTDPRIGLLLQAVHDHPDLSQLALWDAALSQHASGQFNFGYVERMMPRLQRWRYIWKGKKHALSLAPRGRSLLLAGVFSPTSPTT